MIRRPNALDFPSPRRSTIARRGRVWRSQITRSPDHEITRRGMVFSPAMTRAALVLVLLAALCGVPATAQTKRALTLDDHSRIIGVGDPQRSPDGAWVAYTVTTIDAEKDRRNTDIWMVKWDGSEQLRLTSSPDGESSP